MVDSDAITAAFMDELSKLAQVPQPTPTMPGAPPTLMAKPPIPKRPKIQTAPLAQPSTAGPAGMDTPAGDL
jgi:hypothetical protein